MTTTPTDRRPCRMKTTLMGAATLALAAAFAVAPAMTPSSIGGAAWAKDKGDKDHGGGRDKGDKDRGGGQDRDRGGKDDGRSGKSSGRSNGNGARSSASGAASAHQARTEPKTARTKSSERKTSARVNTQPAAETATTDGTTALPPSRKGKWNAMHASDRAVQVHIDKGQFNGTVGALAEYKLTALASSGADLTEAEQASLDRLLADRGFPGAEDVTDDEVAAALNAGLPEDADYSFAFADGSLGCVGDCDEIDAEALAEAAAAADAWRYGETAARGALAGDSLEALFAEAEQRILTESNKSLAPAEQDALLDELAMRYLGTDRETLTADPEADADTMGDGTPVDAGDDGLDVVETPTDPTVPADDAVVPDDGPVVIVDGNDPALPEPDPTDNF